MTVDLQRRLDAASSIARDAGELALDFFERRESLITETKGQQDYVSVADREVEALIVRRLVEEFPDDSTLGEEGGGTTGDAVWVIDPIDGTTNFLRGIPFWCISIAFVWRGVTEIGVVRDPTRDQLFSALRGGGARLNDRAIGVSGRSSLDDALVGFGYGGRSDPAGFAEASRRILERHAEFRRLGSAALSLCYVASGRLDGFWQAHLSAWDALAAMVVIREAGGRTNDFLADGGLARGNHVLAATPGLFDDLAALSGLG